MDYYIFNELSTPFATKLEAKTGLKTFIRACIKVGELGLQTLRLPETIGHNLYNLRVAPNYLISQWLQEPEVGEDLADLKDKFREIATYSPLLTDEEPIAKEFSSRSEFRITLENDTKLAEGLGAAYLLGTLGLSFSSHLTWSSEIITNIVHWYLDETGSEATEIISVKHVSQPEHVAKHTTWFENQRREGLQKSSDLWNSRKEFFPYLILCGEVEKQLTKLGIHSKYFDQIIDRLKRLDNYAREWFEGAYSDDMVKQYGLKVSGESPGTLSKHGQSRKFRLPNGERKLFEKHIKTGDLRFHFYPDNETKKIYVGYIGKHLPIISSK
jgi:hypothetical protein